ncbi:glycosyltransferase family 4 protein [Longispora sp. K20-0274]|uniref:glycosyltransferase family 4 protein n=1 Tax=Longispora sp. K20-0274 TaxID=3088255 RepID=UPI00399BD600
MSSKRFDLAVVLNYYAPYVSGLTEAARLLAEGFAARGRRVAVVCQRHDPALPRHEVIAGVEVFRAPVSFGISRGLISAGFPTLAARIARESEVVHLHLPMLEAGAIAHLVGSTPILTTYHLDLWLPDGLVSSAASAATDLSARIALRRSAAVVVNSDDQARNSRILPALERSGWHPIPAPSVDRRGGEPSLRETAGLHIGFMGRVAEEKGIEYLVTAFRRQADPDARLLIAGDYENIAGGSVIDRVRAAAGDDGRVRILGLLRGRAIDDFYASIDLFALPSLYESFGIVQAEAMIAGVPVIAADVAGGRVPIQLTGFGLLIPPQDPDAIHAAIETLRATPPERRAELSDRALALFGVDAGLDAYERLIDKIRSN